MIYLDNAATTFPKPESVYEKMDWANRNMAVNAGRGAYKVARDATHIIDEVRKMIVELVHGIGSEKTVLLPSATIALHTIVNGIDFSDGDVVYVSPYEHNAIARSLERLCKIKGCITKEIPLLDNREIDVDKFEYMCMKNKPKCICCTHVSNVTGYILPVEKIFEVGKEYDCITVLDASQSMGLVDIDIKTIKADFVVFAGHKTIYGPFGTAGFIDASNYILEPAIAGGTGSDSLNLDMPATIPGRYEAASKDIVSIAGLHEALKLIDVNALNEKERELSKYAIDRFRELDNVILYTPESEENHISVISFNVEGYLAEDVGSILDADYDIAVRTGYHCAPFIHKYLEDEKFLGTVRIGIGQFNSKDDIDELISALEEL